MTLAAKVVVPDEICSEDGKVNPDVEVIVKEEAPLEEGLSPRSRPELRAELSDYYQAVFDQAKSMRARGDRRPLSQIVDLLLNNPTQEQQATLMSHIPSKRAAARPASAARPVSASRPASARRLPPPASLEGEEDDFFLPDPEEPAPRAARPASKARPTKSKGFAALRAAQAARSQTRLVQPDLAELLGIEGLSEQVGEPAGYATIELENGGGLQIPYHWYIADKIALVLVLDTRFADERLPVEEMDNQATLQLTLEDSEGEQIDLRALDAVFQFDWGVFRFMQFLLAD